MLKSFKKIDNKKKRDDFLTYQKGEVVPIESNESIYPPFLNDKEDNVKHFNSSNQKTSVENKGISNLGDPVMVEQKNVSPSDKKTGVNWVMSIVWLFIIGGLLYYSLPILQHFTSETPKVGNTEGIIEETSQHLNGMEEKVKEGTDTLANKASDLKEGSGLVNNVKEHLPHSTTAPKAEQSVGGINVSNEHWVQFLSSSHNNKQELLTTIRDYTLAYASGEINHNRYRLLVNRTEREIQRQNEHFINFIQDKETSNAEEVITVIHNEWIDLKELAVALSSTSATNIVERFNQGVENQNYFNDAYRFAFKEYLNRIHVNYQEVDGKIIF